VTISSALADRFRPYRDQLVDCAVQKITPASVTPGPWRIDAVTTIDRVPVEHHPLTLTIKGQDRQPALFQVIIEQGSDNLVPGTVSLEDIDLVIVRKREKEEARQLFFPLELEISDGPSYAYLTEPLSYLALRLGGHMRVSTSYPFRWFFVFSKDLPPGEYEAWLVYHDSTRVKNDLDTRSATTAFRMASRATTQPATTTAPG